MPHSSKRIIVYQKYTFYLLFTLKFPFITDETPKYIHQLWEFVSWFSVVIPIHLSVCHFIAFYQGFYTDSIDVLSNNGIQGAWLICSFVTMLQYKLMSQQLGGMFDEIDATFQWRSAKGRTYVTLDKCYKYANCISCFWQIGPVSVVLMNFVRPFFKTPLELPSCPWYFLDLDNPFNFAVAYFFQSWAQLVVVCCFAVGSSLFCSFSLLCCGQFNILKCSFKNLVFTSGVYKRFPEALDMMNNAGDRTQYLFAEEMDDTLLPFPGHALKDTQKLQANTTLTTEEIENFRKALANCVKHQHQIQNICGLMETFINFFAFLRVFELTAQICFMAFLYTKTNDLFSIIYGVFAGFDLFLLTYPAEHITYQNYSVGTSLILGPWYLVAKYFHNEYLIIMSYSQQPISFTAGKIIPLNADRLRQAFTTAFSYYTLLSSFDEEQ